MIFAKDLTTSSLHLQRVPFSLPHLMGLHSRDIIVMVVGGLKQETRMQPLDMDSNPRTIIQIARVGLNNLHGIGSIRMSIKSYNVVTKPEKIGAIRAIALLSHLTKQNTTCNKLVKRFAFLVTKAIEN